MCGNQVYRACAQECALPASTKGALGATNRVAVFIYMCGKEVGAERVLGEKLELLGGRLGSERVRHLNFCCDGNFVDFIDCDIGRRCTQYVELIWRDGGNVRLSSAL